MERLPQVHVGAIRAYIAAGTKRGVRTQHILTDLGIHPSVLSDGMAKVSLPHFFNIQNKIRTESRESLLDLYAGAELISGAFGTLQYLLQSRSTVHELLLDIIHYSKFITEYADLALEDNGSFFSLKKILRVPGDMVDPNTAVFCFSSTLACLKGTLGFNVSPAAIYLMVPQGGDFHRYRDHFGCEIKFNSHYDEMIFYRSTIDMRLPSADPRLASILEAVLNGSPLKGRPSNSVRERVSQVMMKNLANGRAEVGLVSKELGVSSRSLQRFLSQENTTFREVLDNLRRELSSTFVGDLHLPSVEVSSRLGFSDVSSFDRAFRRWHGKSRKNGALGIKNGRSGD